MPRRGWVIVVGGVLVIATAVGLSRFRTTTTPVTLAFEGAVGTDPGDPGVYAYATDGFEEVDAFGGGGHEYPAITRMTIIDSACGPIVRWQPIEERWTEWEHCGPDLGVTATTEYHEWFGVPDLEEEHCDVPRPITEAAEDIVCVAGPTTETYRVKPVGTETLTVGGVGVDAIHVLRTSVVSGESQGTTVVDEWWLADAPLLLRLEIESGNVTSSPIGDVTYSESVVLVLQDLMPTSD